MGTPLRPCGDQDHGSQALADRAGRLRQRGPLRPGRGRPPPDNFASMRYGTNKEHDYTGAAPMEGLAELQARKMNRRGNGTGSMTPSTKWRACERSKAMPTPFACCRPRPWPSDSAASSSPCASLTFRGPHKAGVSHEGASRNAARQPLRAGERGTQDPGRLDQPQSRARCDLPSLQTSPLAVPGEPGQSPGPSLQNCRLGKRLRRQKCGHAGGANIHE